MSRRQSRLTRERIAAVALAIPDKDGFEAVSMRRVAQELNVGTMSLYYYVKTKDDLIAVMDDALMAEALFPSCSSFGAAACTVYSPGCNPSKEWDPFSAVVVVFTSPDGPFSATAAFGMTAPL